MNKIDTMEMTVFTTISTDINTHLNKSRFLWIILSIVASILLGITSCQATPNKSENESDNRNADTPNSEACCTIEYTATQKITPKLKGHSPSNNNYKDPDCDFKVLSHNFNPETGRGVITLDRPMKVIAVGAFATCEEMTSITIPTSVTTIKDGAFVECNGLTELYIPDSVTDIGKGAFMRCENLKEVRLSNNITTIPYELFYFSEGLERVTIPEGVTSIGDKAFFGCESLRYMHIPESVTEIGDLVFYRCTSLKAFTGKFATDDLCALIVGDRLAAFANGRNISSYTIPSEVSVIESGLMASNEHITSLTLNDNIKLLGYDCFDCPNLKQVYCNIATPPYTKKGTFHRNHLEPDGGQYYQDDRALRMCLSIHYIIDWSGFGDLPYNYEEMNDDEKLKIYIPKGSLDKYTNHEDEYHNGWNEYKTCFVEM